MSKFGTSFIVSIMFPLLNTVHFRIEATELLPFEPVSEVKEFFVLPTAIESNNGVIWVGSLNGLVQIRPGENGIFNTSTGHMRGNHVTDVASENGKDVWASILGNGVFYLNTRSGENYHLQDRYGLDDLYCYDLAYSQNNTELYILCDSEVYILNLISDNLSKLRFTDQEGEAVSDLYSFGITSNNTLLLGTWGNGLYLAKQDSNRAQKIGLEKGYINRIENWFDDLFIISTDEGVYSLSIDGNSVNPIISDFEGSKELQKVYDTAAIDKHIYLVAFYGAGLKELDLESGNVSNPTISEPALNLNMLGTVSSLEPLQDGLLIAVGGENTGLHTLPLKYSFTSFFDSRELVNFDISFIQQLENISFLGDSKNLLKIDYEDRGISLFTKDIGYSYFIVKENQSYLLSTYENGFVRIDNNGEIIQKSVRFQGLPDASNGPFNSYLRLSDGNYLLGTERGSQMGVFKGNFEDGFEKIHDSGVIASIESVGSDKAMIATVYTGLFLYDSHTNKLINYLPEIEDLFVDCIEKLSETRFFLCLRRDQGLVFDLETEEFQQFLPNHPELRNIRDAALDEQGMLWIATSRGLYVYDETDTSLTRITASEGVKSKEFSLDGILNLGDRLIIPGNKGIVEIDVDKAKGFLEFKKSQQNRSFITKFNYILAGESEKHVVIDDNDQQTVTLPHSNIVTRLQFSHDNFLEMEGLAFDVRLIGLNDDWITLDIGEYTASYTTLKPGQYEFQVRVNDPRSRVPQPVKSINLTILPPWWQTTWAYISYVLFLTCAIYLFSWYRNKRLIQANKLLKSEVDKSTRTISRLLAQKQTFFANVSHEFRTPLSLIIGPLDKLAEKLKGTDNAENLSIMRRNANRLMRLVDQILDLAKLESNQQMPKQLYEAKSSLEVIAASFSSLLEDKGQKIRLDNIVEARLSLIEDSFEMIFTNLISNAIKYCPNGTEINISMSDKGRSVQFVVADNGDGISAENLEILFQRFTRFYASEDVQGSGIGLAFVKQLVETNGGEINVESEVGKGTKFFISLPVARGDENEDSKVLNLQVIDSDSYEADENTNNITPLSKGMSEKQGNSQNSKSTQYKLLIVEDNPDLRRFIAESLKDEYELDIAKDGLEGLKRAQAAIPDLILSDVLMPNMDGYQLSNAIRSDDATSHIPIVLLTAKGDDLSRMKGWQEEVDDYLSKPFKMSELKMRIKRLLSVRDILRKKHTSELTNNLATKNDEAISFQTKKDREFFFKFHQIMCENYANERFSRTDAANQLNMSLRQLSRKLEALVDYSFTEYLRKYRLQRSTELLLSGKQVTEVSYDVGFNSPSYFSSCFKAEFGEAPRDYITARQSSSS